jgi:hypothetical protein
MVHAVPVRVTGRLDIYLEGDGKLLGKTQMNAAVSETAPIDDRDM